MSNTPSPQERRKSLALFLRPSETSQCFVASHRCSPANGGTKRNLGLTAFASLLPARFRPSFCRIREIETPVCPLLHPSLRDREWNPPARAGSAGSTSELAPTIESLRLRLRRLHGFGVLAALLASTPFVAAQGGTQIYLDTFAHNGNGWGVWDTPDVTTKMEPGAYLIDLKKETCWYSGTGKIRIAPNADFEIEAIFKPRAGGPNSWYGISWGTDLGKWSLYYLTLNLSGGFAYGKCVNGTWSGTNYELRPFIHPQGTPNLLSIRRVGAQIHLAVNRQPVATMPAESLFGDGITFMVGYPIQVDVTHLSVTSRSPVVSQQCAVVCRGNFDGKVTFPNTADASRFQLQLPLGCDLVTKVPSAGDQFAVRARLSAPILAQAARVSSEAGIYVQTAAGESLRLVRTASTPDSKGAAIDRVVFSLAHGGRELGKKELLIPLPPGGMFLLQIARDKDQYRASVEAGDRSFAVGTLTWANLSTTMEAGCVASNPVAVGTAAVTYEVHDFGLRYSSAATSIALPLPVASPPATSK